MPKFTKAPPALVATFEKALRGVRGAEPRKMFGYPAAFLNGNLFASLFGNSMILKLSEEDRAELTKAGAKPFEPMPGRAMREYLKVPPSVLEKPAALAKWVERSRAFVATLPPKEKKAK
ncbi:MAG TPA: TfoX/Sxy family protein [Gemmatimonadales bacterium]|nr:TfoX/Sxy family protein [Gemmatimonadales bacterium]